MGDVEEGKDLVSEPCLLSLAFLFRGSADAKSLLHVRNDTSSLPTFK